MASLVKSVLTIAAGALLMIPIALVGLKISGRSPMPLIDKTVNHLPVQLTSAVGLRRAEPVVKGTWPPVSGEKFPDMILNDQNGQRTRLSEFAGKIILVEYAAIPCKGCQAFAGGKEHGGFGGFQVQPGLESVEYYARKFADVQLGSDQVVFVQVLLYGEDLSSPTAIEVAQWAEHFGMDRDENKIVLQGDPSMLGPQTYDMIPGFQLIDRDFKLRSDSCGHHPKDDLYRHLLPLLGQLASGR